MLLLGHSFGWADLVFLDVGRRACFGGWCHSFDRRMALKVVTDTEGDWHFAKRKISGGGV